MMDSIIVIKSEFSNLINDAENIEILEEVRIAALGKKGRITSLMKNLGQIEPEERKLMGQNLNILKQDENHYKKNIFFNDSLLWDNLPSQSPTFTIMANALRNTDLYL